MDDKERNNLQEIITQSLDVIKEKMGVGYAPEKVNLAEMEKMHIGMTSCPCHRSAGAQSLNSNLR